MANRVGFDVQARGAKGAASELDKLRDKFDRLQKQGAKGFAIGAGVAATNAAFNALGMGVQAVTGFLSDSADAFREDQKSVAGLDAALRSSIPSWDGNTKAIEETIEARMKLGFSDDEQRESLKGLVAAYGDVTKALEVQGVAMDLARFKNISLTAASDLLVKVQAGSFRALKSLGIDTKGVTTATEAMGLIMKKVGGQAAKYATTDLGKLDAANLRIGESQERIGEVFSRFGTEVLPVVADGLETVVDVFADLGQAIEDLPDLPFDADVGDAFGVLGDGARGLIDPLAVVRVNLEEEAIAAEKAKQANEEWGESFRAGERGMGDLGGAADDLGGDLDETADDADDLAAGLDAVAKRADDARKALGDLSSELFDTDITTGDLAEAQQELAELIKEGPKGHEPGDWTIYQGDIATAEERIFDLNAELAQEAGPQAFMAFLDREEAKLGAGETAARRYIDALRDLNKIKLGGSTPPGGGGGIGTGKGGTGYATGGHWSGTEPALVGEEGPEILWPNGKGGDITNARQTAGMMGGPVTLNVTFTGRVGESRADIVAALQRAASFTWSSNG